MVEGKKTACLPGGLNTSPTPGRPRWRQSREENRKWETATAEQRNAGMEDRMEGRVQWPAVGDRPTWSLFRSPRQGCSWPYRSRQAKARNTEGRQGGVVWAPWSPPRARRGSCCPQGPAAREPVGVGE